ncbi:hypothetical protein IQ17_03991 [Bradyrhizobium daqingense]|uniref:Uncharacterized protein n=1 Tax=Bradyrhizobium daqingense TaxID=993502 RepID=A0A562L9J5_9BRAD|nr:hypothetical protein IQ17_03991 [Bradyrhizobium daqingense]
MTAGGYIARAFVPGCLRTVMAGLVPAIHDLRRCQKHVDARDKPGHDEFVAPLAIIA